MKKLLLISLLSFSGACFAVQDYVVLQAYNPQDMANQVLAHEAQGWVLQGGVAIEPNNGGRLFYQAMVLNSSEKAEK